MIFVAILLADLYSTYASIREYEVEKMMQYQARNLHAAFEALIDHGDELEGTVGHEVTHQWENLDKLSSYLSTYQWAGLLHRYGQKRRSPFFHQKLRTVVLYRGG